MDTVMMNGAQRWSKSKPAPTMMQKTICKDVEYTGIGLHSGIKNKIMLSPAEPHTGIVFRCPTRNIEIPATWNNVTNTTLNTKIGIGAAEFMLIEHLMSALHGLEIDNVIITLCGNEVPIADGSSLEWVKLIDRAGVQIQSTPRRYIRILKTVSVTDGDRYAKLLPSDVKRFRISTEFDGIGLQKLNIILSESYYRTNVAFCRTFGYADEINDLDEAGFAKGAGLDNVLVMHRNGAPINKLRATDEIIQHKLLDAIGDLYCAGSQIIGEYDAHKPGHKLNWLLLEKLFYDDSNWTYI